MRVEQNPSKPVKLYKSRAAGPSGPFEMKPVKRSGIDDTRFFVLILHHYHYHYHDAIAAASKYLLQRKYRYSLYPDNLPALQSEVGVAGVAVPLTVRLVVCTFETATVPEPSRKTKVPTTLGRRGLLSKGRSLSHVNWREIRRQNLRLRGV
jgi:hypothetical protein